MSGFELVGVVLGLIALTSQEMEGLRSPYNNRDLTRYQLQIGTEGAILRNTVEILLYNDIPQYIDEMLSDTASPRWRDPGVAKIFKLRLGEDDCKVFLDNFQQLHESITSLRLSVQKVQGGSSSGSVHHRKSLGWAMMRERTKQQLDDVQRRNRDLQLLVHPVFKMHQAKQALHNMNGVVSSFQDAARVAQSVEAITTGKLTIDEDIGDTSTLYSVTTEDEGENLTLSYLSLTLESKDETTKLLEQDALIDTGASFCAISVSLVRDLFLEIHEDAGGKDFSTAILGQTLHTAGRVQLKLRWISDTGQRKGTKLWAYVVYGLSQPLILSHDFIHNHPEVWSVAKKVVRCMDELQVLWFGKQSTEETRRQQECRAKRIAENKARTEASDSTQSEASSSLTTSVAGGSGTTDTATSITSTSSSTKDSEHNS